MDLLLSRSDADLLSSSLDPSPRIVGDGTQLTAALSWVDQFRATWVEQPSGDHSQGAVRVSLGRDDHEALTWLARRSSHFSFGQVFLLGLADLSAGILTDPEWSISHSLRNEASFQWQRGTHALLEQAARPVPESTSFGTPRDFPMSREQGDYDDEPMRGSSIAFMMEDSERIEAAVRSFTWGPWTEPDPHPDEPETSDARFWVGYFVENWEGPLYWGLGGFGRRIQLYIEDVKPLIWMAQRASCSADAGILIGLQRMAWEPIHDWDREAPFPTLPPSATGSRG